MVLPASTVGASSWLRSAFTTESLEAARRITNPCVETPATGEAPAADPKSPAVIWREHWDLMERKPYYHNLVTNEISWSMPPHFPTRFPEYYGRMSEEYKHGMRTADHEISHQAAMTSATPIPSRSMREKLIDYGPSGLALYTIIHFAGFVLCYSLLWFGVDLGSMAHAMGFDVVSSSSGAKGATFLAAVAMNKLLMPVQILMTLAIAPKLTPMLKYGWRRFYFYNQ